MFFSRPTHPPHHRHAQNLFLLHLRHKFRPHNLHLQQECTRLRHIVPRRSKHDDSYVFQNRASFASSPPVVTFSKISCPTPHILLVSLNRPKSLNCVNSNAHYELEKVFHWYDNEPQLRCAVLTGAGRAFCAGADLKEWNEMNEGRARGEPEARPRIPQSGFAGLGRRLGKKPSIGAVNGLAYGGGMEIVTAMDMVVAAKSASFALPEVRRGVGALTGVLPRLNRMVGKQRALEMALTGRTFSAEEGERWGLVNVVVDDAAPDKDVMARPVVRKALGYAQTIADNSPDSVIVIRDAVLSAWYHGSVEDATREGEGRWAERLNEGENIREGVRAFVEHRPPQWVDSKL